MNNPVFGQKIFKIIEPYKIKVETKIKENISSLSAKSPIRDACEFALMNGGKRFRPSLVYLVAEGTHKDLDVTDAALAVEYFHTASLIADDLPCMDDDDLRRESPSLHKKYSESIALLASYALIAAGYEKLAKNTRELKRAGELNSEQIGVLALENAAYNTGLHGATGGQYLDLFPPEFSLDSLKEIIYKKTVSLFEISFVLGWLYGGGEISLLEEIKKASSHFGMAFQIADDIGDMEQDAAKEKKSNLALALGKKAALNLLKEELDQFFHMINRLQMRPSPLTELATVLLDS